MFIISNIQIIASNIDKLLNHLRNFTQKYFSDLQIILFLLFLLTLKWLQIHHYLLYLKTYVIFESNEMVLWAKIIVVTINNEATYLSCFVHLSKKPIMFNMCSFTLVSYQSTIIYWISWRYAFNSVNKLKFTKQIIEQQIMCLKHIVYEVCDMNTYFDKNKIKRNVNSFILAKMNRYGIDNSCMSHLKTQFLFIYW